MTILVSYQWLNEHLDDPDLVIVDTRPKVAYTYGHIPNSISLVVDQLIQVNEHGAHLVLDSESATELLGSIGINHTKTVVVAGEPMDPSVARTAWTLAYLGHENTKILDVGIGMWQSLGFNITRVQKKLSSTQFTSKIQPTLRVQADELKNLLGKTTILDARTPQEYFGGHIPHSILCPFTDGLGQNGFLFDRKESLQNLFEQKQIPVNAEVICYCMHGHRASSLFFQLKIAGFEKVRLYDGSFVDWHSKRLMLE
jgi:thiosulfate/3-mercaptopyruvate sulfurtransferase